MWFSSRNSAEALHLYALLKNIFTIDFPPALIYHLTPSIMRFVGWFLRLSGIFFFFPGRRDSGSKAGRNVDNLDLGICNRHNSTRSFLPALLPLPLVHLSLYYFDRKSFIQLASWILLFFSLVCIGMQIKWGQLSVVKCFLDAGRMLFSFASLKILKASIKLIQLKYLVRNQFYKLCHFHLLKLARVWA